LSRDSTGSNLPIRIVELRHQDDGRFLFPHEVVENSSFNTDTNSFLLRCLQPFINWFNPYILVCARHNHDLKCILSEKAAMFYISDYTVQFRSNWRPCVTHPVDHELWSRSRVTRASVEPPSGYTGPKLPKKKRKKGKKDKNSGSNAKIFEVSRKNSSAAEMSNR
jgi:hypothetical protein